MNKGISHIGRAALTKMLISLSRKRWHSPSYGYIPANDTRE